MLVPLGLGGFLFGKQKMQIANIANAQTMTSREIAELTGKEISHVHRDIRVMIEQLGDDPELDHITEDRDGRTYVTCIHLTKNLTYTLVSGYNVKMRKAIIDRWQELEAKQSKPPAVKTIKNPALALIAQLAQELDAMHSAQEQQAADLALVKSEVLTIGARTQPDFEFFTVLGYANRLGRKIDAKTAANFGRKCATLSKQCGIMVGTVPDARFGSVGTYHVSMLDSIFEAEAGKQ
jgi:phage regulator Rha-like protein